MVRDCLKFIHPRIRFCGFIYLGVGQCWTVPLACTWAWFDTEVDLL